MTADLSLPLSLEGCDTALRDAALALPGLPPRRKRVALARIDLLLDRRLMLTCDMTTRDELQTGSAI